MTTTDGLLALVVSALAAAGTDAGSDVFRPGDWPTQNGQYPRFKIRVVREFRQSIARSTAPEFIVTSTVRVIGEVSEPADVDDAGAAGAEAALWRLKGQAEAAIINSYPLTAQIQQIASIDTQLAYNSDAETHLAGIQSDFVFEFYQGPEDFAPVPADDVDELTLAATNQPPTGFDLTLNP